MKCIYVMDEQGNSYEMTYRRRAKGLVKKGRARFVGENTICLVQPPQCEEETQMLDTEKQTAPLNLTAAEIFEELKKIREDTGHIALAMEKLEKVPTGSAAEEAVCLEKVAAIEKIATAREETNQALIRLYEKMYDDVYYEARDTEEEQAK